MTFRTLSQRSAAMTAFKHREIKGVSIAVPNQSMTVREMLNRFRAGQPINVSFRDPEFDEDGEENLGRPIQSLDLTEVHEMAENAHRIINEHNNKIAADEAEALEAAKKAAWLKEYTESQQVPPPIPDGVEPQVH